MKVLLVLLLTLAASASDTIEAFGHKWTVRFGSDWKVEQEDGKPVLQLLVARPQQQPRRPIQFALAETAPWQQVSLEADVKRRYFEYVKARALYRVVAQSVLDAQGVAEDIKYRFERGEVTFETYNQTLLDKTNSLQNKISYAGDVLIAKSSLEEKKKKKLEEIQ